MNNASTLHAEPGYSDSADRLQAVRNSGLLEVEATKRFAHLTELASSLTGAPIALISMVEAERQFFTSQVGLDSDVAAAQSTPISQSVCRTVVETGVPLEVRDLGSDERFVDHGARTELGIEAYCGVPIRDASGHVLGSFCVLDKQQRAWDSKTVDVLRQLAAVVADSISTSSDYLSMVEDLQSRLIPSEMMPPPLGALDARYRPVAASEDIGGDFYDSFRRADGSVDIVIGDVVGHGVASTQAAAQLRAAARAVFTGAERSPAEIINRMSQSCADLPGCMCAAIIVANFSAAGDHVTWARAGAMPPILTGPNARVLDGGGSPPLGVGRCEADEVGELDLFDGDGLLFFTDGLVERRDESLDVGLARIVELSRGPFDLDELIDATNSVDQQRDDIAVIRWSSGS